jgi:hypothetical protein
MVYETHGYNSLGQMVSKTLTNRTKTELTTDGASPKATHWHPRVTQEESIIYEGGSGISSTAKYFYEGNLSLRETLLLQNKTEVYGFVTAGSSLPSNPMRTTETTYLINDSNYPTWVQDIYKAQNMVGLATV